MLDRVGKAIMLSAESETAEIIRRRLFEWDSQAVTPDGKILISTEARKICKALWVAKAYKHGYEGLHTDPLIGIGTAPLDDPLFRVASFEQLGTDKLEAAVITDICGRKDSHGVRLDKDASPEIKKSRLHNKVATTIFFESNGGQTNHNATLPEKLFSPMWIQNKN